MQALGCGPACFIGAWLLSAYIIHKKTKDSQQLNIEILSYCEFLYLCG